MEASNIKTNEASLLSGLSANDSEARRLAATFWEKAWPKLEANGWVKVRG